MAIKSLGLRKAFRSLPRNRQRSRSSAFPWEQTNAFKQWKPAPRTSQTKHLLDLRLVRLAASEVVEGLVRDFDNVALDERRTFGGPLLR